MVNRVSDPVIPLTNDLKVCRNCFLLDCKREGIDVLILIKMLIHAVSLHLFEVLDDLV